MPEIAEYGKESKSNMYDGSLLGEGFSGNSRFRRLYLGVVTEKAKSINGTSINITCSRHGMERKNSSDPPICFMCALTLSIHARKASGVEDFEIEVFQNAQSPFMALEYTFAFCL